MYSFHGQIYLFNTLTWSRGIKAEKRKAEEKANPKKKAKSRPKTHVKAEDSNEPEMNIVGVHPSDLEENIEDDVEEEPFE